MSPAQVGISLYDPTAARYVYNYQGDKYFIPASNTKLLVIPSGDPTFLHPAYPSQPVMDLMKKTGKKIWLADDNWQDNAMGRGWSWDDYNDDYAAERSPFPIYGNMIHWVQERQQGRQDGQFGASPSIYSIPDID